MIFTRAFLFSLFTDVGAGTGFSKDMASDAPITSSHPEILYTYIVIYLVTGALIASRWREVLCLALREKFMVLLLGLAALSCLWSGVPGLTLARTVALSGCTLFGVYFGLTYNPAQQLKLLGWAAIIIIASSYFFSIFLPDLGVMPGFHDGLWRGIYGHKNVMGRAVVLGSIALFFLACRPGRKRLLFLSFFWAGLALLLFSASRLSMAVYISIFLLLACYLLLRRQWRPACIAILAVAVATGGLVTQLKYKVYPSIMFSEMVGNMETSAAQHGGTETLMEPQDILRSTIAKAPDSSDDAYLVRGAGRLNLWREVWRMTVEHPWLGYGYGGFWRGTNGPSKQVWERIEHWNPTDAHNGFMDLLLELGLIGLGLFLASAALVSIRALQVLYKAPYRPENALAPGIIAFVLLSNIGESDLLMPNYICWVLYVSSAITLLIYFPKDGHLCQDGSGTANTDNR